MSLAPGTRLGPYEIDTKDGFRAGAPRDLFRSPASSPTVDATSWTCDEAGERFFVVVRPAPQVASIIEVVTDFHSLVSRK